MSESLAARTGKALDEWVTLVQASGVDPLDQNAVRGWLRSQHRVPQNSQWAISDAGPRGRLGAAYHGRVRRPSVHRREGGVAPDLRRARSSGHRVRRRRDRRGARHLHAARPWPPVRRRRRRQGGRPASAPWGSRTSRPATPCARASRRGGCWRAPSSASWRRGRTGWSPPRRRRGRGGPARSWRS